MYWAFAASQVIVSKLGVGLFYTNYKTQPTSSLYPSPITLMYININNIVSIFPCTLISTYNQFIPELAWPGSYLPYLEDAPRPPEATGAEEWREL